MDRARAEAARPGSARCTARGRDLRSRPSGRNAGFANCFWHLFDRLEQAHGREAALDLCDLAAESVDAIGDFALERELQIGYRKAGHLKVATTASQDASWLAAQQACERAGRGDEIAALDVTAVRARCDSPLFRGGSFVRQGASVQPALLARGCVTRSSRPG